MAASIQTKSEMDIEFETKMATSIETVSMGTLTTCDSQSTLKKPDEDDTLTKVYLGMFICTMVVDVPALVAFLVIGATKLCATKAPLFLLIGGSIGCVVYLVLIGEILIHKKYGRFGYLVILTNLLEILKLGCYIGAAFSTWVFWFERCDYAVYYSSAIVAPIATVFSFIQIVVISKL